MRIGRFCPPLPLATPCGRTPNRAAMTDEGRFKVKRRSLHRRLFLRRPLIRPHRAFEERPSFDGLWGLLPEGEKGPGADFSFASSEFKTLGAFFCNFATLQLLQLCHSWVISRIRARSAARPCTISCGYEAPEPIPFPGADLIFSSRCGAISGRLRFSVSDDASVQRSTISSAISAEVAS